MKQLIYLSIMILSLFLSGCKKGEDDPLISMRTRKARLSGEWKLEKADLTLGIKDDKGVYASYIYTFDGSSYKVAQTGNGASFSGNASLAVSFGKKGEFTISQQKDKLNLSSTGTWDFQGGVGSNKSKETVIIHLSGINGSANEYDFFNKTNYDFVYSIKELRNKKLVLTCNEEMILLDKEAGVYVTAEYTFTQ